MRLLMSDKIKVSIKMHFISNEDLSSNKTALALVVVVVVVAIVQMRSTGDKLLCL
jgi:hypothetical protein